MGTISINDLLVRCIIGVRDYEREEKQDVLINVDLKIDLSKPAQSDKLKDSLDYTVIEHEIFDHVKSSSYRLLEALATSVA